MRRDRLHGVLLAISSRLCGCSRGDCSGRIGRVLYAKAWFEGYLPRGIPGRIIGSPMPPEKTSAAGPCGRWTMKSIS